MFAASKTASVTSGYQISRSLRFNDADAAYLNRTPASATNRRTWTYSVWLKRGTVSKSDDWRLLACRPSGGVYTLFSFINTGSGSYPNALQLVDNNGTNLATTPIYRDPSAWYHIVLAVDTTQATASNRVRIYVNGIEVTAFSASTYPTQNVDLQINTANAHNIGRDPSTGVSYFDGYMTEINFIDGQALTPSSFGSPSPISGVWGPTAYLGTYGTNGFYLNFSDNSNTTAATLGKDYSGNGNNYTPNNFSVTAGAGNDSLVDSPTSYGTDTGAGGEVRGNYATLNPLKFKSGSILTNGNLNLNGSSATYSTGLATISPSSGNYYMEMLCTGTNTNRPWGIGVVESTASAQVSIASATTYFVTNNSGSTINYYLGATATALSTSSTWVVNDIISLAWNVDSGKFWVGRNGVWYPSSTGGTVASNADVAAGNFPTFSITYSANTNPQVIPAFATYDTTAPVDVNFGQRAFAYTAPSGFKALCTQNLPTPNIIAANQYFNPVLYTGTGSTLSVTGVGFQPDWVWVKGRSSGADHAFYDAVRGVQKQIESNTTTAETTETTGLTTFGTDGFTTGALAQMNTSAATYVAWNWKANGAGSSNTSGSITSTVSANTASGFSVVTYTGSGVAGTIGHGLGVAPSMIIVKSRSATGAWPVYHKSIGNGSNLVLNTTAASASSATIWNSTSPTSSVFSVGINTDSNTVLVTYIAYCFVEVAGYSKFGSYTGNDSTDGPFAYCGFRPAFVLIKSASQSGVDWVIFDTKRSTSNVVSGPLFPNAVSTEGNSTPQLDILSNGFKWRNSNANSYPGNVNGDTYIFAAFAESPFKYALAR